MLEFYLCGAFQLVEFTCSRGIWCDGVVEVSIEKLHRCAFRVAAAAYCPQRLAPVEIEFVFAQRRALEPTHTIVRFGILGADGELVWHKTRHASIIVADRPRSDADWAIAVQLTNEKA